MTSKDIAKEYGLETELALKGRRSARDQWEMGERLQRDMRTYVSLRSSHAMWTYAPNSHPSLPSSILCPGPFPPSLSLSGCFSYTLGPLASFTPHLAFQALYLPCLALPVSLHTSLGLSDPLLISLVLLDPLLTSLALLNPSLPPLHLLAPPGLSGFQASSPPGATAPWPLPHI